MVFQKLFWFADFVIKKHFLVLSMLNKNVLLIIFVETMLHS